MSVCHVHRYMYIGIRCRYEFKNNSYVGYVLQNLHTRSLEIFDSIEIF